jgi:SNF2 family DNA or RNA helicase
MGIKLLQWQADSLKLLQKKKYLLLSCPTGIGKSVLARAVMSQFQSGLIVAPSHLIPEYADEFEKLGKDFKILGQGDNVIDKDIIYLMSNKKMALYGVVQKTALLFLVVDEAHSVKNHKSKIWKNLMDIADNFYYKIAMSATLIPKNTADLATNLLLIVDSVRKQYGASYYKFAQKCIETKKQWFGTKSIEIPVKIHDFYMKDIVENYVTAYTYESAGLQVPECIEKNIIFDVDDKFNNKMSEVKAPDDDADMNKHAKFCQLSNCFIYKDEDESKKATDYSMDSKLEALDSILDNEEGQCVVFYWYKHSGEILRKHLGLSYMDYVSGMNLDLFANSGKKILLANYKSMGEGIRVKSADTVVLFDLIYDAGLVTQAEGRLRYVNRPTVYKVFTLIPKHKEVRRIVDNIRRKKRNLEKLSNGGFNETSGLVPV